MVGDPELARLLRRKLVDGEPCPCFVHEVDAYSASPEELVHGRSPAPDTKFGEGNSWVFLSPATYLESRGGEPKGRRKREVSGGGGGEARRWHQENGKKAILGSGKVPVGAYTSTFSYRVRKKNPDGSVSCAKPGWIMVEIDLELEPQQDDHRLVLCKIYMSNRTDPETSTAPAAAAPQGRHEEEDAAAAEEEYASCPAAVSASWLRTTSKPSSSNQGGMIPPTPRSSNGLPTQCQSGSAAAPSLSKGKAWMNTTTDDLHLYGPHGGFMTNEKCMDIPRDTGPATTNPAIPVFDGFPRTGCDTQSFRPSWEGDDRPDWVNTAHGTLIWKTRDTGETGLTCILLKSNITVLNIENTSDHDGYGLLPKVSSIVAQFGFSPGYMVANDDKISLALVPLKLSSCELTQLGLHNVLGELRKIADVRTLHHRSVISLIGNQEMSPLIHAMVFQALWTIGVKVQMMLQGSSDSKVIEISLVVNDSEAEGCVRAFHSAFSGDGLVSEDGLGNGRHIPESSSAAPSSSGVKRKADGPPPAVRQPRTDTTEPSAPEETEPQLSAVGDLPEYFDTIVGDKIPPLNVDHGWYPSPDDIDEMARGLFPDGVVPPEHSVEAMLAEISPDELLGSSSGGMPFPPSSFS